MQKTFYKHIKVVRCKKRLQKKKDNIEEMRALWKLAKNGHNAKILSLGQKIQIA